MLGLRKILSHLSLKVLKLIFNNRVKNKMAKIMVGQGGGPTTAVNDTLAGVIFESQQHEGLELIGSKNGLEGGGLNPEIRDSATNLRVNLGDLSDYDPDSIRGIPGAYLGTTRLKLKPGKNDDLIQRVKDNMARLGIDAIIYIGGNDTASTLSAMDNGIHVQKTVDNDLPGNDHNSGWGSASRANAEIIKGLVLDTSGFSSRISYEGREVYSTAPVVVYQTQGRKAGWLTLGAAFAKVNEGGDVIEDAAPHIFLPKEIPFNEGTLLDKVDNILSRTGYAFIVVGEELVLEDGKTTLAEVYRANTRSDEHGNVENARSGSFSHADAIASIIKSNIKVNSNSYLEVKETPIKPGHIQRSLYRTLTDANEAFEAGREAVRAVIEGDLNISIALLREGNDGYHIKPGRIPLETVADQVRQVEPIYLNGIEGPTEQFF